ncbi:MAG: maleylpyruvate isomerase family mycothiol-dependent enzyme [Acidimicrobiales bacterium]
MTDAINALKSDRAALLAICDGFDRDDWEAPSGCAGWSVKDVVSHVGALFWMVVDPGNLPDVTALATERAQDALVEARRSMDAPAVLADYESVSASALEVLASFAGQDLEIPLGDLGTYAASLLPTAFCFDHYVHIRADLFAPRGPLTGQPPPSDELRLVPVLDWIEAALPQQNAEKLDALGGSVELVVDGPGARTIRIGSGDALGQVASDAHSLVLWVTQRATWDDVGVKVSGDERGLAAARNLHVF